MAAITLLKFLLLCAQSVQCTLLEIYLEQVALLIAIVYDTLSGLLLCIFIVNDTLDEMLDESGDEEEQDAIVTQVLDEIGIDISGRVSLVSGQC